MRPSSILALALLLPLLASPAFGAPADDSRPIISASEILAKIERGEPVVYDGVIVVGDLNLSGLDLPTKHVKRTGNGIEYWGLTEDVKLVESPIIIIYSEIRGGINFGNTIFQEPINFGGTNFNGDVDFIGANFGGVANFGRGNFSGYTNFRGANFSDDANFGWANFSSYSNFRRVNFNGDASFRGANFNGDANFEVVNFSSSAYFGSAQFRGDAYFDWANFSGVFADFEMAVFSGYANFVGGVFGTSYANFPFAVFSGNTNFGLAEFNGSDVSFYRAEFSHDADFRNAGFTGNYVDFDWAIFSGDVYFGESSFDQANLKLDNVKNIHILQLIDASLGNGSTICLNGTDYERLYVHWNQIQDGFVYNGEAYLNLVKNFKAIEYFEDADDCYYQYRRERQSMRCWGEWAKYTDILGWITCGYGVRFTHPLILGLFVVLVSAVYYWRRDAIRRLKGDEEGSAKFSDAFYFSMMTFTTVGYGDWYPLDRHRKVVMIEGIVGWLTLSLFLVTLANLIIR